MYNEGSDFGISNLQVDNDIGIIVYHNNSNVTLNNKLYTFRRPANGNSAIKIYNNYNIAITSTVTFTFLGFGPNLALVPTPPYAKFMYIYVNEPVTTGTLNGGDVAIFTERINAIYNVPNLILDKTISTSSLNPNNNFAFLRPKPDETSVIINFSKKPGEVSQTILIPQDASENVKSKVGDIFRNFNTDLQDTTIQNTL
jgi:hypothetical protein